MAFAWLTFGQAKAELAVRLNDPSMVAWTTDELGAYLGYAMRIWNCLTAFWIAEYPINLSPPFASNWFQANGSGSPREPQLSDIDLYTLIEYLLMEPPTGGTWTGTNQFSMAALAQAVQGRRDECLQAGATNVAEISLPVVPNTSRVTLPDNVLDVIRCRYVPASGQGSPVTLSRGDAESFRVFTPNYLQTRNTPLRWDVISGPPLALTVDTQVPVPCVLQVLSVEAEPVPSPPTATPLGLPDDWSWVPMFGAVADLLNAQEEARDTARAKYCVPLDSQILTRGGWKNYDHLRIGEEVLGYNSITERCEWTSVSDVIVLRQREVATYKARPFQFRCTDNHRWVFKKRINWRSKGTPARRAVSIRPFDEESTDSFFVQAAPAPDGPGLGTIKIDEYLHRGRGVEMVLQMTSGERRAFILGMLYGEGNLSKGRAHRKKENPINTVTFAQKAGPVYDAMKLACAMEGIFTSERNTGPDGCSNFCLLQTNISRDSFTRQEQTTIEDVWCPTTGLGTWVMRQGRNITITGNCLQRYEEGLGWLRKAPWLLEARVNNVPLSTPSVVAADRFNYEWQSKSNAFSMVVVGATDLYSVAPVPTANTTATLVVVENAPVPTSDAQEIQVPRDVMDALLDEAEHLSVFRRGASEIEATMDLHKAFLATAGRWNSRIRASGIFPTTLRSTEPRLDQQQPRFAALQKG